MNLPKPKITGTHTTMIPPVPELVNGCALRDPNVTRVALGQIEKATRGVQGRFRVKFTDINGGVLLQVRGNLYVQKVYIYTDNIQETRTTLAKFARGKNMDISFGEAKQNDRSKPSQRK